MKVGDKLPDFSVTMNDSSVVTGATLRKSASVIMFFHSSCPDCRQTLPHVQRLYNEYASRGVQFALISREEEETSVAAYWAEKEFTMPYSAQKDRRVYELFARRRVPRIYVSDSVGVVRYVFTDNPTPTAEVLFGTLNGEME